MMRRFFTLGSRSVLAAAVLLLAISAAAAQDFPARPIRFVVAFAPGGATDVVARLVAERLTAAAGQNVIVENKPGANGQVAAEFVMRAEPDGYTLFFTTLGAIALNPNLRAHLTYNPRTDFSPVAMVARNTIMLAVKAGSHMRSFADFLAAAKAGKNLSVGVTGVGAATYLSAVLLQQAIATRLEIVPYRGAAQALSDLLGGHIDAMFGEIPLFLAPLHAGTVRALASTAQARAALVPDVPTFGELGYPEVLAENWTGVVAPAHTPPPVIEKLGTLFERVLTDPAMSAQLARAGVSPAFAGPAPFRNFIDSEIERWGKVIRENGVKVE